MPNGNNTVPTRFTTGKARLTYAFLWEPRSSSEADGDSDEKGKKYSTSVLIPKGDQATIDKLNFATQHAIALGMKKGYWSDKLPGNFKLPLRDGDAESAEKGEEYAGHWFLNASSTRAPRIVDINRNEILDPSEVYSGCYARVCINLFPFKSNGNRGIGCGLEAVQKLADGEALGGVPVDLEDAFGDWSDGSGDQFDAAPCSTPAWQAPGYPVQQPQNYPIQQQASAGYPTQQAQSYPAQQQAAMGYQQASGYPAQLAQQQAQGYPAQQYPPQQQPQGYPVQQSPGFAGAPGSFASGVAAADSILPPHMFGQDTKGNVA